MPSKQDIYYIFSMIFILSFFGLWIIPQITQLLTKHAVSTWIIILIDCVILPLMALSLLWLIIQEIQEHYKTLDFSENDKEIKESFLINKTFSEEDEKFIEQKMREQLEKDQFEDEEIFEFSKDLILSYITTQFKTNNVIPLIDISKGLEIPLGVVKDILLLLIADNLVDGMVEENALIRSD